MASNSSLGAALGGEGTADKIPGGSLPTLVLGRLGYPAGAGAPRLVSAEWHGETDRLFGRELEIQVALRDPHNELLTHFLNMQSEMTDVVRALLDHGADINIKDPGCQGSTPLIAAVCNSNLSMLRLLIERGAVVGDPSIHA